jgi:hypothetical protein
MRIRPGLAVVLLLSALAGPAAAAEWGLIRPGETTMDGVRGRYGQPTRALREKIEGYDTESWIYEGAKAPAGMVRLTVEFGLLQAEKFRGEVVRAFRLEPKPGTFNRGVIGNGWGYPDLLWREGEEERYLYKDGLLVHFDKEGWNARLMIFTVPQPRDPTEERR